MPGSKPSTVLAFIEKHWLLLTGLCAALIGANLLVQLLLQWSPGFLTFELGFALLTLVLPYTLRSLYRTLTSEVPSILSRLMDGDVAAWHADRIRPLISGSWLAASGLAMLLAGAISTEIFGIPWTGGVRLFFYAWSTLFFLGYGLAAWLFFILMVVIARSRELEPRASMFLWPRHEIEDLYFAYFKRFLLGASLYIIAVIAVWISPGGAWIAQNTGIGRLWVFPPGAMVIVFFLFFNYRIHLLLSSYREASDTRLSEMAETRFAEWSAAPSEESAESISALLRWRREIRREGTWPLDYKSVLATVVTLLLPTVKAVLDLIR